MKKYLLLIFSINVSYACGDLIFTNNFEAPQITPQEASRFLSQATFGPTEQEILQVQQLGFEGWIDEQLCMPATTMTDTLLANVNGSDYYPESLRVSWNTYLTAPDQLRQKVAFTLSQIMVISNRGIVCPACPVGIARYNDILVNNAFGDYRQLLEEVTLNPMMGFYLSMLGNEKSNEQTNSRADENYAREIKQLFSIGLYMLNNDGTFQTDMQGDLIPTYGITQVKELAKVMTGWHWANTPSWEFPVADASLPMAPFYINGDAVYHDYSAKSIIGHSGDESFTEIPEGLPPEEDLSMALDVIFTHPNVGPFIGTQLIQKFITSNPSPAYVARVADVFNDNGFGIRGDLGAVIKAVLLDPEARDLGFSQQPNFGKLREPMLRLLHMWRAFGGQLNFNDQPSEMIFFGQQLGQSPYEAPSVFNFFRPDYISNFVLGSILTPEFQLNSESNLILYQNLLRQLTINGFSGQDNLTFFNIVMDGGILRPWILDSNQTLIDNINLLLMNGEMSQDFNDILVNLLSQLDANDGPANTLNDNDLTTRAALIIYLVMSSPQYLIQK